MNGRVERCLVSESGYYLIIGWIDDEGAEAWHFLLSADDLAFDIPTEAVLRHSRADVEKQVREGAFDYGFLAFGRSPAPASLKRPLLVEIRSASQLMQVQVTPQLVSDKRLLDTFLIAATTVPAHGGWQSGLHAFLAGTAGNSAISLFQAQISRTVANYHVERFRPRPVPRTFVTVLFGTTEPVMLQPVLFRQHDIDFGEWLYVCNSPEDATAILRLGRMMSDLYDVMVTVIVMSDNVGFGAANNVAVGEAASDAIYIVNPDVYPLPEHAGALRQSLDRRDRGTTLWGGLLFYDAHNLMHSGMYFDHDVMFRSQVLNRRSEPAASSPGALLRVEHFDKGVPFDEAQWPASREVPAITGAAMAFQRASFEKIGGFSARYIYGHYEDADLSLRWAEAGGLVAIDPTLRLVHLEGQGSRPRGEQFRGAAIVNRHIFTLQHGASVDRAAATVGRLRSPHVGVR